MPWSARRFPVRLPAVGEGERVGDRGEGRYDAGTRKRPARVKEDYDPANLFRRNRGV
ncbi:hypothetical protein [Streptomyces broussonetiae]|uniref:hypothetical protein n=1 Tax=Streptomyces broussonetiae TaxID=2686304 RepID=UPI0035D977AD